MSQRTSLEKLFGSPAKVKVLQTFLASPNAYFSPSDVAKRAKMGPQLARKNIEELSRIGILKVKQHGSKKGKKAAKK